MVRVGGGWVALEEFLQKNDPCRGRYSYSLNIYYIIPYEISSSHKIGKGEAIKKSKLLLSWLRELKCS